MTAAITFAFRLLKANIRRQSGPQLVVNTATGQADHT